MYYYFYEYDGSKKVPECKDGDQMEKYIFTKEKREVLESLRQPFSVFQFIDGRLVTLLVSDGFCELFGYKDRTGAIAEMNNGMYRNVHPDDRSQIADTIVRFAEKGGRYDELRRMRKKDSSDYFIVHAMGENTYTEDGTRILQVWYTYEGPWTENRSPAEFNNTEALRNALQEQRILKARHYDFLTGLPNMTYFFELAEKAKEKHLI